MSYDKPQEAAFVVFAPNGGSLLERVHVMGQDFVFPTCKKCQVALGHTHGGRLVCFLYRIPLQVPLTVLIP